MIHEVLRVGPLQCNCSILGDENTREAIVIDPGDEIASILLILARHRLTVKQIIVTHAHIDHIGGAAQLRKITGAPVLFNQNDLPLVRMMDTQAGWLGIPTPEVLPPDIDATDGLRLQTAGLQGQVIHTPGHTPGSICLLFEPTAPESSGLLIAGDTLFSGSIGRTDLPGGDGKQILHSIRERLMPLPDATRVLPGHGKPTTIGEERDTNHFLN